MMDILDKLREAQVSVEPSIHRFADNKALYLKFIGKFPKDPNYDRLMDAFSRRDYEQALIAAHTLKGVSSNLGMDQISAYCAAIVKKIREGDTGQLQPVMDQLQAAYQTIFTIIVSQEG